MNVVVTRSLFKIWYIYYWTKGDIRNDIGRNNIQNVGLYWLEIKLILQQKKTFLLYFNRSESYKLEGPFDLGQVGFELYTSGSLEVFIGLTVHRWMGNF